jgi:hypothetical protein
MEQFSYYKPETVMGSMMAAREAQNSDLKR